MRSISAMYKTRLVTNSLTQRIKSGVAVLMLALVLPVVASAYTVILHNGQQLEIPAQFVVTDTLLKYEASPGISVSIKLSNIDIAATERANQEPPGSLLKRAERARTHDGASATQASSAEGSGPRKITNKDLEVYRRARIASEKAYERERKELGLPSKEEMRQRDQEEGRWMSEQALQSEMGQAQLDALRAEINTLNTQLNYLGANQYQAERVDNNSANYGQTGSYVTVGTVWPPLWQPVWRPGLRPDWRQRRGYRRPGYGYWYPGYGYWQPGYSSGYGYGQTSVQVLAPWQQSAPVTAQPQLFPSPSVTLPTPQVLTHQ